MGNAVITPNAHLAYQIAELQLRLEALKAFQERFDTRATRDMCADVECLTRLLDVTAVRHRVDLVKPVDNLRQQREAEALAAITATRPKPRPKHWLWYANRPAPRRSFDL